MNALLTPLQLFFGGLLLLQVIVSAKAAPKFGPMFYMAVFVLIFLLYGVLCATASIMYGLKSPKTGSTVGEGLVAFFSLSVVWLFLGLFGLTAGFLLRRLLRMIERR